MARGARATPGTAVPVPDSAFVTQEPTRWERVRGAFDEAADRARAVLAAPAVGDRWREPSICPGLTLGGLGAHLLGGLRRLERSTDVVPAAGATIVDPAEGFDAVRLGEPDDLARPPFSVLRDDAERLAAHGHGAISQRYTEAIARISTRLDAEDPTRPVGFREGAATTTTLDEYLVTRVVELVIHADDLAESAGVRIDAPSAATADIVIGFLVRADRYRLGDAEMLRALAGRRPADLQRAL
jgi:uncharacterized protein (TIGR03083 family)